MDEIILAMTVMITIILSLSIMFILFSRNCFNIKKTISKDIKKTFVKRNYYLNDKYILVRGILFFSIHQLMLLIFEVSLYYIDISYIFWSILYIFFFFFVLMVKNSFFDNKKWLVWLILSGLAITVNMKHREYNKKYTFPIYKENIININHHQQIDIPFFEKNNLMPVYLEEVVGEQDYFNYVENYQGEKCKNYVFFPSIEGKHNTEISDFYKIFKNDECSNLFYFNYFDINGNGIMFRSQFIGGFKNIKYSNNRFFLDNIDYDNSIIKNVQNVENINIVYRDDSKQIALSYLANMKEKKNYFTSKNYLITQEEEILKIEKEFEIKSSNDFHLIEIK